MKNFLKISILPVVALSLTGFAGVALAQAPLGVQFVPDPLFNKSNFLPLDSTAGTVTVTNNSGATQNVLTEAINVFDAGNFSALLHLSITGNSGTLFDDSLANFLSTAGEVPLGAIGNGESKTFTYNVSFIDSSDNSYQGKTLGFDVCVGFNGGTTRCGNTVVGGEGGGGGGTPPGGGTILGSGGGGGGGSIGNSLFIFNEKALDISNVGQSGLATITWETNLLSTSQVVYGPVSGGPYALVLIPPNFGYPFATPEDTTKVTNHSFLLTGLTPGETYVYRVISRASPPTISVERRFTVPLLAQAGGSTNSPVGAVRRPLPGLPPEAAKR
ncbi:fibronectin type III domain-containing protein [Candidatus Kaiserbacteria bacterium]|nr:fibronectin type III domain-containing protein [Candidatus Kaiserbacteria bacterium]